MLFRSAVLQIGDLKKEQSLQLLENPIDGFSSAKIQLLHTQAIRLFKLEEQLYYLCDTLDRQLASLKKNTARNAKEETQLQDLEKFRAEIIETNRKTIFFDEFKYRRRLSDVYVAVCTALEPFSPSKIGALEALEKEFADLQSRFKQLRSL